MELRRIYKWTLEEAKQQIIQEHAIGWAADLRYEGYGRKQAMEMALVAARNALADTSILCFGEEITEELVAIYTTTDSLYDAEELVTEWETSAGLVRKFVSYGKIQDDCEDALAELINR